MKLKILLCSFIITVKLQAARDKVFFCINHWKESYFPPQIIQYSILLFFILMEKIIQACDLLIAIDDPGAKKLGPDLKTKVSHLQGLKV